tara:strand:+ start:843 stop:1124 length:282 start_codon:yes stop_codon:yes gene_type:complete
MKNMKRKFPIGTLVEATVPRPGTKPLKILGLVISDVIQQGGERADVFFGPNEWIPSNQIVSVLVARLKPISRAYAKCGALCSSSKETNLDKQS